MIINNVRIKSASIVEPNDNDKYQIVFAIDNEKDRQKLIDLIDEAWEEEGVGKPRNLAYFTAESDPEYGVDEDEGKTIFIASQNAHTKDGKELFLRVYDAHNQPLKGENIPNIGKGSIINLSTSTYVWTYKKDMGVKLNLDAIQIVKVVEKTGGPSPFGETEGFTADTFSAAASEDEPKKKKKKKKKNK
jgi:hypothetical protein